MDLLGELTWFAGYTGVASLGNESSMVGADPSGNSGYSVCSCTNDEDLNTDLCHLVLVLIMLRLGSCYLCHLVLAYDLSQIGRASCRERVYVLV